jgi:hypothetical protein
MVGQVSGRRQGEKLKKARQKGPLQPNLKGVKMALMKRKDSLAAKSRSDITPFWGDIQI